MSDSDLLVETIEPAEQLAFAKARFEYCATIYEREVCRKERLEKKTDFYLSFVTLFLGAIFLNVSFLSQLRDLIRNADPASSLSMLVYASAIVLAVALLCTLVSLFQSIQVRRYTNPYPRETVRALFEPQSAYLDGEDLLSLLRANAKSYAIAVEDNKKVNDRKAKWIRVAAATVFIAVMALVVFLTTVVCLAFL